MEGYCVGFSNYNSFHIKNEKILNGAPLKETSVGTKIIPHHIAVGGLGLLSLSGLLQDFK